jgi:ubiquitin C-terminal hydrolase
MKIKRTIKDYELVGMICHLGVDMTHGHYIYYAKLGPNKWA